MITSLSSVSIVITRIFQSAEGIGVVVGDIATAVTLGGCPEEKRVYLVAYDDACANDGICLTSDNYTCDNGAEWMVSYVICFNDIQFSMCLLLPESTHILCTSSFKLY